MGDDAFDWWGEPMNGETPAGLLYDPNYDPTVPQPELPGGVPTDASNISDVTPASGFGASAAGAPRDTGGIGEWLVNAGKNLSGGFFSALTAQPAVNRQPGGAFSSPGPNMTGRFSVQSGVDALGSSGVMMLLLLLVGLFLVFGARR